MFDYFCIIFLCITKLLTHVIITILSQFLYLFLSHNNKLYKFMLVIQWNIVNKTYIFDNINNKFQINNNYTALKIING